MTGRGRVAPGGVALSGLLVAVVGFLLTRFTVTLVTLNDTVRFLLAGVVPLALGLALTAFGVALAVGDFGDGYARTVALWCLAGATGMGVFVVVTLYGTFPDRVTDIASLGSQTHLSNLFIGGAVGGALTGVYAARNRRQRLEQRAQTKRMVVLNRVFRDAVLNSITAIRGHMALLREDDDAATRERAVEVVDGQAAQLESSVDEIRHLARRSGAESSHLEPIPLDECLEHCVETARERYPEADVEIEGDLPDVAVWADEMVAHVFELVVENAIIHSDAPTPAVTIAVDRRGGQATVSVSDNGPGLPAAQQRMLAEGTVDEFDDPTTGFGLNVAALLVESYRGDIRADVDEAGTTLRVGLPVVRMPDRDDGDDRSASVADVGTTGIPTEHLALAVGASLVAGVLMGLFIGALGGGVPVIGALYGVGDPVVGWLTHVFHSVVFALAYVAILGVVPRAYGVSHGERVVVGICWGVLLWLVAAGFVMPLWLELVGIPATVPTWTVRSLLGHLLWGASLGALYSAGVTVLEGRVGVRDTLGL